MPENTLKHKSVKGAQWSLIGTIINAFMQVAVMVIMARLIEPRQFGVLAMAHLFIRFATYFSNFGVAPALIRKKELHLTDVQAGFYASMFCFSLMGMTVWFVAPFSRSLLDAPEMVGVVRLLAINFCFIGLGTVSQALLQRDMRFKYLSAVQVLSYFLGYVVVGIPLAWMGYGVWALVLCLISQSAMRTVLMYLVIRHSVKPSLHWRNYTSILSFGGQHSLAGFITFVSNSVDSFSIGKFMGDAMLGLYSRCMNLINLPMNFLSQAVLQVSFPGLSQAQHSLERMRTYYLKALMILSLLILPIGIGVLPVASDVIFVVFGEKWVSGWPALAVYSLIVPVCLFSSISWSINDIIGNITRKVIWQFVALLILVVCVMLGFPYGLAGVAVAALVGQFIKAGIGIVICRSNLEFKWGEFISCLWPGLLIGTVISATMLAGKLIFWNQPVFLRLLLSGGIAALASLIFVQFFRIKGVQFLANLCVETYPVIGRIRILNRIFDRLK